MRHKRNSCISATRTRIDGLHRSQGHASGPGLHTVIYTAGTESNRIGHRIDEGNDRCHFKLDEYWQNNTGNIRRETTWEWSISQDTSIRSRQLTAPRIDHTAGKYQFAQIFK